MKEALKRLLEAPPDGDACTDAISTSYVLRLLAAFEQEEGRLTKGQNAPTVTANQAPPHAPQNPVQRTLIEPLSRQEHQVLRKLVAGQTYAEIAEALVVSPNTIKTQVSSIYRKLGVGRRAEAMTVAAQLHLL